MFCRFCVVLYKSMPFRDVNNDIMELLIMLYACKTSAARQITVVMPYMPYTKQCRMRKRSSIVAKLLCDMITRAGKHLLLFSRYGRRNVGFFQAPTRSLRWTCIARRSKASSASQWTICERLHFFCNTFAKRYQIIETRSS